MTPVEERIDQAKRRVRQFMEANRREGKSAVFSYHRLYFEDLDDLLTEHSAREEREKEIKLGRALIDRLQGQVTWEKTEHDKARDEWLAMRERLNSLHRAITGALEHTKPPESWVGNAANYEGGIEAEPYAWLATLVAEALADHPAFLDYDDAATAALPATESAQPEEERDEPPEGYIVPEGDERCSFTMDACTCMKRKGHDGLHACVHGGWRG